MHRNVGTLFFSNLTLDFIEDCIPTECERSTSKMDVDRAILAAAYRLAFSIFFYLLFLFIYLFFYLFIFSSIVTAPQVERKR